MKQTILVVEDDKMIRDLISIYLKKSGYDVVEAVDGEEAKEVFLSKHPCLIILDLMLPKLSGEEFCTWVREQERNEVSIIMLSAKSRIEDKINGLKIGADDYIVKPFEPEELLAHIEAVLRRTGQFCQKITYDGLCIKPRKGEVLLLDQEVKLTKHEFNLLYYFMENPNTVISRESLLNQLYPYADKLILDRTIDAHIKKLRKKIEENPAVPKRIITVRGMGYKFVTE
ncbi:MULTISPECIES: response regulator transcription factor [Bacillaceae]|jgi:two-component system alkaline phosphatase synthesis response regulator PhoP|uniref:Transcriptional regulator n=2 Tax=Bacillaceae TaxID=186817 RepID=A0ABR5MG57_9BACI|nr:MULTISPECIES: response regulator transcription factor [Bacillaceae]KPH71461.1 transcriptional regulator [Oceanobacillus caeni]MBU8791381.1 response regulator transcription factor [Oceanobacillus caeni]MDA3129860.1 response regulator [Aliibacillus thermotolerans]MDF1510995.1 response regulator transcription factor [Robertmurraya sp. DFI.2.37]MED4475465.1 response regulator transcription factor [Oceanobacillus caeni]